MNLNGPGVEGFQRRERRQREARQSSGGVNCQRDALAELARYSAKGVFDKPEKGCSRGLQTSINMRLAGAKRTGRAV